MKNKKLKSLIILTMFIMIEIVLTITPLGFIQLGPIRATTLHIPVILAGFLLGYKKGMIVGLTFGILSVLVNTFMPTVTSFVFSPFYSLGEFNGNFYSLIIAIVPRVILGISGRLIYDILKFIKFDEIKVIIGTALATILHTTMVMSLIYLFFKNDYSSAKEIGLNELVTLIITVITVNGFMEMLVAVIIVLGLYKALKRFKYE